MSSSYPVLVETTDQAGVVRVVGTLPPVMTQDDVMALGMAVVDAANAADRSGCVTSAQIVLSYSVDGGPGGDINTILRRQLGGEEK